MALGSKRLLFRLKKMMQLTIFGFVEELLDVIRVELFLVIEFILETLFIDV